jgi:SAM-dependent methyltransferase
MSLPFKSGSFGLAVALQVLDSVSSPLALLGAIADVLPPGGSALLASPYDWSAAATPMEAWIGGHSQRSTTRGAAEPLLRSLLTPGGHPHAVDGLVLRREIPRFPWHTRIHDRSTMLYDTHIVVAEATDTGG